MVDLSQAMTNLDRKPQALPLDLAQEIALPPGIIAALTPIIDLRL